MHATPTSDETSHRATEGSRQRSEPLDAGLARSLSARAHEAASGGDRAALALARMAIEIAGRWMAASEGSLEAARCLVSVGELTSTLAIRQARPVALAEGLAAVVRGRARLLELLSGGEAERAVHAGSLVAAAMQLCALGCRMQSAHLVRDAVLWVARGSESRERASRILASVLVREAAGEPELVRRWLAVADSALGAHGAERALLLEARDFAGRELRRGPSSRALRVRR